jgi:peptidoglycan pentaglycine glycine transferase (the first glycine)
MQIKELTKNEYLKFSGELNVHPLQSFAWGELKRPLWKPLRLGVFNSNECLSILTILIRKIPFINKKFGYIPRGITVKNWEYYKDVLDTLVGDAYMRPLSFILADPEVFKIRNPNIETRDKYEIRNTKYENLVKVYKDIGFKESGRQEQPIRTVVLDLTKSEEELLADMRSKHRQYIRKAKRKGIIIEEGKNENIEDFVRILEGIVEEKEYDLHKSDYYKRIWEEFRKSGMGAKYCTPTIKMFVAKLKGEIVGSYMLLFSRDGAYEMFGGCNREGRDALANYAMKWETIKYSKSIGKKYYDQWGAEFVHPGLVQFKEGFGGQVVEYPGQFVYVNDKFGYWMYKLMRGVDRIRRCS